MHSLGFAQIPKDFYELLRIPTDSVGFLWIIKLLRVPKDSYGFISGSKNSKNREDSCRFLKHLMDSYEFMWHIKKS